MLFKGPLYNVTEARKIDWLFQMFDDIKGLSNLKTLIIIYILKYVLIKYVYDLLRNTEGD